MKVQRTGQGCVSGFQLCSTMFQKPDAECELANNPLQHRLMNQMATIGLHPSQIALYGHSNVAHWASYDVSGILNFQFGSEKLKLCGEGMVCLWFGTEFKAQRTTNLRFPRCAKPRCAPCYPPRAPTYLLGRREGAVATAVLTVFVIPLRETLWERRGHCSFIQLVVEFFGGLRIAMAVIKKDERLTRWLLSTRPIWDCMSI